MLLSAATSSCQLTTAAPCNSHWSVCLAMLPQATKLSPSPTNNDESEPMPLSAPHQHQSHHGKEAQLQLLLQKATREQVLKRKKATQGLKQKEEEVDEGKDT